jgi:hypothetical protein
MHQLGELFVGRFGLSIHEIKDFARFVGHGVLNVRLNRAFDKLGMTDFKKRACSASSLRPLE